MILLIGYFLSFLTALSRLELSYVLFLVLLSWTDLSFALPATALGSVVNTVGARVFLKENVTVGRWAGTLLICGGVILLSF